MELKEFIEKTLIEISVGVQSAQVILVEDNILINPKSVGTDKLGNRYLFTKGKSIIQDIEFDVVLTTEEKKEGQAGITIFNGILAASANQSKSSKNANLQRVRFKIPVFLPSVETPAEFAQGEKQVLI